jgi:hypothetical protein
MARPLRLDIEDGWYHVINRGLEKRRIFPDERTNLHFLDLLSVLPTRFGLKIHAYLHGGEHRLEKGLGNVRRRARQWRIACRLVSGP